MGRTFNTPGLDVAFAMTKSAVPCCSATNVVEVKLHNRARGGKKGDASTNLGNPNFYKSLTHAPNKAIQLHTVF